MTWESDQDQGIEIKDRSKYLWCVVAALVLGMIAMMFIPAKPTAVNQSQVNVKHVLVSYNMGDPTDRARAFELIEEARQQLVDGVAFKTVAKNYSNDPGSANLGGNLGWMARGSLVPEFEKYAWEAPIGQLSGIIQTQYGFHVILVIDRQVSDADAYERELRRRVLEGEGQGGDQP